MPRPPASRAALERPIGRAGRLLLGERAGAADAGAQRIEIDSLDLADQPEALGIAGAGHEHAGRDRASAGPVGLEGLDEGRGDAEFGERPGHDLS